MLCLLQGPASMRFMRRMLILRGSSLSMTALMSAKKSGEPVLSVLCSLLHRVLSCASAVWADSWQWAPCGHSTPQLAF